MVLASLAKTIVMKATATHVRHLERSAQDRAQELKDAVAWFLGLGSTGMVATFLIGDDSITTNLDFLQRTLMCLTLAYVMAAGSIIGAARDMEDLDEAGLAKARNVRYFKNVLLVAGLVLLIGAAYYYPQMFVKVGA